MKVEHPDKLQALNTPLGIKPNSKDAGTEDFATVLNKVSETKSLGKMTTPSQSLQAHSILGVLGREQIVDPGVSASSLLNDLENYQRVLADPEANMRQVNMVVDRMKISADNVKPLLEGLPDGHLVGAVIKDTLMQINMEIARFDRGEYVDE